MVKECLSDAEQQEAIVVEIPTAASADKVDLAELLDVVLAPSQGGEEASPDETIDVGPTDVGTLQAQGKAGPEAVEQVVLTHESQGKPARSDGNVQSAASTAMAGGTTETRQADLVETPGASEAATGIPVKNADVGGDQPAGTIVDAEPGGPDRNPAGPSVSPSPPTERQVVETNTAEQAERASSEPRPGESSETPPEALQQQQVETPRRLRDVVASRLSAKSASPARSGAAEALGEQQQVSDRARQGDIARLVRQSAGGRAFHATVSNTSATGDGAVAPTSASLSAPSAGAAGQANIDSPGAMEPSVVNQIAEQFRLAGSRVNRQVVIRLNPPELGRVRMTVRSEAGQLRAVLDVDNATTAEQLHRQAPALVQRMADLGVQLRRLDVNVTGDDSSDASRSMLQDGHAAGQQAGEGQESDPAAGDGIGGELPGAVPDEADADDSYVTDESVNLWI